MDTADFICGLMKQNTDALGFIPSTTIESRFVAREWYIMQRDERGKPVGYLLHGPVRQGQPCYVSQHCIELDKRLRGYGARAVHVLIDRCQQVGASSIYLRCGEDLPALQFWQALGFRVLEIIPGGERRQRMIVRMALPLDLPLLSLAVFGETRQ
jgi:GNAT superfamily N-acetyltransferase